MNIPPNKQAAGGLPMGHMAQQTNPQMTQGQQRITQQVQQQSQQPQQTPQQIQQQMQQVQQQSQQLQKTDEDLHTVVPKLYAKVKSLISPLRETLISLVTIAAQSVQRNSQLDVGSLKTLDPLDSKFNKTMEEFYSICDKIEYYLKTLIEIRNLSSTSERYMPLPVITPRNEKAIGQKPGLSYTQFLMTVRNQVSYAKAVHDALVSVANSLALEDQ